MLCPYCGKEMREGCLITPASSLRFLSWIPKEYYNTHIFQPLTKQKIKENGGLIVKPEIGAWENPHTFYVCEECGKMITDIGK
ncbi:MAG: hypothetical protein II931_03060 [Clostridia bacterium]|nr:hypothetical protein [Clostridia bacterium]